MTNEEQKSTNDTQTLDHQVSISVFLTLGEAAVDDMAEVRLHADMKETCQSENTIDPSLTHRIIQSSGQKHVLNGLKELHGEKEEDS